MKTFILTDVESKISREVYTVDDIDSDFSAAPRIYFYYKEDCSGIEKNDDWDGIDNLDYCDGRDYTIMDKKDWNELSEEEIADVKIIREEID